MNDTLDAAKAATMVLKQGAQVATCCAIVAAAITGLSAGAGQVHISFPRTQKSLATSFNR